MLGDETRHFSYTIAYRMNIHFRLFSGDASSITSDILSTILNSYDKRAPPLKECEETNESPTFFCSAVVPHLTLFLCSSLDIFLLRGLETDCTYNTCTDIHRYTCVFDTALIPVSDRACSTDRDCSDPSSYCSHASYTCVNPCDAAGACGEGAVCSVSKSNRRKVCKCPSGFEGDPETLCFKADGNLGFFYLNFFCPEPRTYQDAIRIYVQQTYV